MVLGVTVAERCLLYLLENQDVAEDSPAVGKIVQDRIAEALRVRRAHASRALRILQVKGQVRTIKVHPRGSTRRRLGYFLTDSGFRRAKGLQRRVEEMGITFVDAEGTEQRRKLFQILPAMPRHVRLSELLANMADGRLDFRALSCSAGSVQAGKAYLVCDAISVPHFQGRRDTLVSLGSFIADPSGRVFVIVGLPGIGKTAVASEWVSKEKGRFHIAWHRLSPESSPREILACLGDALRSAGHTALSDYLKRPPENGHDESLTLLERDLAGDDFLLVLDNAHCANGDVSRLLSELLRFGSGQGTLRMLLLSRERVCFWRADDVTSRRVRMEELDDLSANEAEALLASKGIKAERRREIIDRCGGHPLSLELASEGLVPLDAARRTSTSLISKEVFSRLDAKTYDSLAFAAVVEEPVPLRELGAHGRELMRMRLLRDVGDGRADVHDLVREALIEDLPPERLAALYVRAAEFLVQSRNPAELLTAIRHYATGGRHREGMLAAMEHGQDLIDAGFAEGLLSALYQSSWEGDAALRPRVMLLKGNALFALGRWAEALRIFERCSDSRNPRVSAEALLNRGKTEVQRHSPLAIKHLRTARNRLERLGALRLLSETDYWIGGFLEDSGHLDEAREAYERGKAVAFHAGDRRWEGLNAYGIAAVLSDEKNYEKAIEEDQEALRLLEREGSRLEISKVCAGFGGELLEVGRLEEAETLLSRAAEEARKTGALAILASALYNLASLKMGMGCTAESVPLFEEALAILEVEEKYDEAAWCAGWLASIAWRAGQNDRGDAFTRKSMLLLSRVTEPALRVKVLRQVARSEARAGRTAEARAHLLRGVREANAARLCALESDLRAELQKCA